PWRRAAISGSTVTRATRRSSTSSPGFSPTTMTTGGRRSFGPVRYLLNLARHRIGLKTTGKCRSPSSPQTFIAGNSVLHAGPCAPHGGGHLASATFEPSGLGQSNPRRAVSAGKRSPTNPRSAGQQHRVGWNAIKRYRFDLGGSEAIHQAFGRGSSLLCLT